MYSCSFIPNKLTKYLLFHIKTQNTVTKAILKDRIKNNSKITINNSYFIIFIHSLRQKNCT